MASGIDLTPLVVEDLFKTSIYNFDLDPAMIATRPAEPRDRAKLLVLDVRTAQISHRGFFELPDILNETDCLVANETSVIAARLKGHRVLPTGDRGGKIEVLLVAPAAEGPCIWECMMRSAARAVEGFRISFEAPGARTLKGRVIRGRASSRPGSDAGTVLIEFDADPRNFGGGEIPLPPYIVKQRQLEPTGEVTRDSVDYQTVYARESDLASVAAPTAGLHFTPEVLARLSQKGIQWETLNLAVGPGTFKPVEVPDTRDHQLHAETFELTEDSAKRIIAAKTVGKRVIAVGTTATRALESAFDPTERKLRSGRQSTSLFIRPSERRFSVVDGLLTNFHLPESTLLMLVCSLAGDLRARDALGVEKEGTSFSRQERDFLSEADRPLDFNPWVAGYRQVMEAYRQAIREKYRFYSYGDAMLII